MFLYKVFQFVPFVLNLIEPSETALLADVPSVASCIVAQDSDTPSLIIVASPVVEPASSSG